MIIKRKIFSTKGGGKIKKSPPTKRRKVATL